MPATETEGVCAQAGPGVGVGWGGVLSPWQVQGRGGLCELGPSTQRKNAPKVLPTGTGWCPALQPGNHHTGAPSLARSLKGPGATAFRGEGGPSRFRH